MGHRAKSKLWHASRRQWPSDQTRESPLQGVGATSPGSPPLPPAENPHPGLAVCLQLPTPHRLPGEWPTPPPPCACWPGASGFGSHSRPWPLGCPLVMMLNYTTNPPTPFLWQAPASTQKTKRKKNRPASNSPERPLGFSFVFFGLGRRLLLERRGRGYILLITKNIAQK